MHRRCRLRVKQNPRFLFRMHKNISSVPPVTFPWLLGFRAVTGTSVQTSPKAPLVDTGLRFSSLLLQPLRLRFPASAFMETLRDKELVKNRAALGAIHEPRARVAGGTILNTRFTEKLPGNWYSLRWETGQSSVLSAQPHLPVGKVGRTGLSTQESPAASYKGAPKGWLLHFSAPCFAARSRSSHPREAARRGTAADRERPTWEWPEQFPKNLDMFWVLSILPVLLLLL